MIKQEDIKSDRLNDDVVLFMGCTLNETIMIVLISLMIGLLIGMPPLLFFFHSGSLGFAVSLMIMVVVVFILLIKLSRLKRGKPAGFYQQYLKIKISKTGLLKSPYVMRSGCWSTERKFK